MPVNRKSVQENIFVMFEFFQMFFVEKFFKLIFNFKNKYHFRYISIAFLLKKSHQSLELEGQKCMDRQWHVK